MVACIWMVEVILQTMEEQNTRDKRTASLVLVGHWLYDNLIPMTIQIFAINYDFWFDITEGYHEDKDVESLNDKGEQYVFHYNCDDFFKSANFPTFGGMTIEEAQDTVNKLLKQPITWDKPLTTNK